MSAPAIEARELGARYAGQSAEAQALESVTLEVQPGERLLLLGPNGAGKSTFIRVLGGLMRPSAGEALIQGAPARKARRHVGVVSHATFLYGELSSLENVRLYAELYDVAEPIARGREMLERMRIAHLADVRVERLSRGQQQRVALARALVHDPPVLLLDEPDTGLDVAAFDLLAGETLAHARSVVLTTHNLAAGLRLGTRAVILAHGRVAHTQPAVSAADAPALSDLLHSLAQQ